MKKNNLVRYSIVAALAGFIFGFDTVVISGANLPIKELWKTSPLFHGFFIMSIALWGTVLGAMFGGIPTQKLGRKKVLLWVGIFFAVSAIGSAIATDPYTFSFFRFVGGVGIGVSSVAAPTYISEISTPATRGRLGAMYQFNIVFGILVAFLSNYFLEGFGGENDWRWMLGVEALPAIIYTLMVLGISESPRWLITKKNDLVKAKDILSSIGVTDVDAEVSTIIAANQFEEPAGKPTHLFSSKYRVILFLAFFCSLFQPGVRHQFHLILCTRNFRKSRAGSQRFFIQFHCHWRHKPVVHFCGSLPD